MDAGEETHSSRPPLFEKCEKPRRIRAIFLSTRVELFIWPAAVRPVLLTALLFRKYEISTAVSFEGSVGFQEKADNACANYAITESFEA